MNRNTWIVVIIVGLLIACCCVGLAALSAGGVFLYQAGRVVSTEIGPALTQVIPILTEAGYTPTPKKTPVIVRTPVPTPVGGGQDTLTALENDDVPASDLRQLAMRLKGIPDIPEVVSTTPAHYALGDAVEFNVMNDDTNVNSKVTATLAYETENVYFFVEKGVQARQTDIKALVDQFQNKTYPTDREFFGTEWTPGVDGDPHLYILYTRGLGANVGGYFDSSSEYSHLAHPYSNEKEMFFLNADGGPPLSDSYWPGTLAHEFQHMIHWYHDRNEESWMNEGASMLAEELNGYDPGSQFSFLGQPDLQLNTFSDSNSADFGAHYDASYLFMKYFLDRFGENATKALVADQANGLTAVDHTLATLGLTDPLSGKTLTAVDVFADWTVANYLNDATAGDGRYAYKNYSDKVSGPTATISSCPHTLDSATVHQYGANYIAIKCRGSVTIDFTGSQQVQIIPTAPHGGRYAFWSNRADESDATLTREFDLTGVSSATLDYWAWWEIEKDFDYTYLEVSIDGGQTWKMVETPLGTDANPTGGNMGWGYTGCSDGGDPAQGCPAGWVEEKVDLSPYAGKKIQVRFEYVTDAALDYPSFMVDDIAVPEINYSCGFEKDSCGWAAQGFARVDNLLPQTFAVQVIHLSGNQTTVERLPLDAGNQGSLTLNLKSGDTAILVVAGTTPFTTEEASYQFEVK